MPIITSHIIDERNIMYLEQSGCKEGWEKRRVWNTVLTYYGTSGFIWNSIRNTKTEKEVRFYPLTSSLKSPSLFFHTPVL